MMESANNFSNELSGGLVSATFKRLPFFKTAQTKFVLFLLAVLFYTPSIENEYALDDGIVIHQNSAVLEGISGLSEILTHDTYYSFYKRMNASDQLTGGRYRPLPGISYAIEQEFIGTYRTGFYMFVNDLNHNGQLDEGKVSYTNHLNSIERNYEYNNFVDLNKDGVATAEECFNCWDQNRNFKNDPEEDINVDGIFNEIDCQVSAAGLRHLTNIILYALVCLLLYQLFSEFMFQQNQDLAFVAAFIFTIHPVHSEVVANVRGRDDLLSLLFIILSLIQTFNYVQKQRTKNLVLLSVFAFLSLLSKEYALVLFVALPLVLFYFMHDKTLARQTLLPLFIAFTFAAFMFMCDVRGLVSEALQWPVYACMAILFVIPAYLLKGKADEDAKGARIGIAFGAASLLYMVFRLSSVNSMAPHAVETEILNNPYIFANGEQAFATKIYVFFNNLKLFVWPHTLVSDYSYNSVEYRSFADAEVWLSLITYVLLLVTSVVLVIRRNIVGFGLALFFLFALPTSNLFFFTQLMYVESFLFHASIGLSIVTAVLILKLVDTLENKLNGSTKPIVTTLLVLFIIPSSIKCWERSRDWKNDVTLFLKDVNNAPNSVLVLGNAGARWIDLADTREITGHLIEGQDSSRFNDYNGTLVITEDEMLQGGYPDKRSAAINKGINYLLRAVELHPRYVNGFLNLGLAYYKLNNDDKTVYYWKYAEYLYPNNPYLLNYYQVYSNNLFQKGKALLENEKDYRQALTNFSRLSIIDPNFDEVYLYMSRCFEGLGETSKSSYYLNKHLQTGHTPKLTKAAPSKKNC